MGEGSGVAFFNVGTPVALGEEIPGKENRFTRWSSLLN
jgi:hypothetical protein